MHQIIPKVINCKKVTGTKKFNVSYQSTKSAKFYKKFESVLL